MWIIFFDTTRNHENIKAVKSLSKDLSKDPHFFFKSTSHGPFEQSKTSYQLSAQSLKVLNGMATLINWDIYIFSYNPPSPSTHPTPPYLSTPWFSNSNTHLKKLEKKYGALMNFKRSLIGIHKSINIQMNYNICIWYNVLFIRLSIRNDIEMLNSTSYIFFYFFISKDKLY